MSEQGLKSDTEEFSDKVPHINPVVLLMEVPEQPAHDPLNRKSLSPAESTQNQTQSTNSADATLLLAHS